MEQAALLAGAILVLLLWQGAETTLFLHKKNAASNPCGLTEKFCTEPPPWPGGALLCFRPLDINSASLEELDLLPGIGASRAAMLLNFRMERGFLLDRREILLASPFGRNSFEYLVRYIKADF